MKNRNWKMENRRQAGLGMYLRVHPIASDTTPLLKTARLKPFAVGSPRVVAAPAEALEAAAEFSGDGRREPGVHVFQAALPGVPAGGFVQSKKPLPAFARGADTRIEKQVGFGGEAQERRAED